MLILLGLFLSLTIGISVGFLISTVLKTSNPKRAMTINFGCLGFLLGVLIGLSDSPLVVTVVTSGFALAGLMLGKFLDFSSTKTAHGEVITPTLTPAGFRAPLIEIATSNFSIDWLMSVVAGTLIGIFLGAGLRINDALNFKDESIPAKMERMRFSKSQIEFAMNRMVGVVTLKDFSEKNDVGTTSLHESWMELPENDHSRTRPNKDVAKEQKSDTSLEWKPFWETMKANEPKYIIDHLLNTTSTQGVPSEIRSYILLNRADKVSDAAIVDNLKFFTTGRKP